MLSSHSIQLRIPSLSSSMRVRLTEATNFRPAVVGGAEQRGALGLELLLRDVEQMLEQLVAPVGGRFAVEGGVAAVEKDAARRVLRLRLGCGDEGWERLPVAAMAAVR